MKILHRRKNLHLGKIGAVFLASLFFCFFWFCYSLFEVQYNLNLARLNAVQAIKNFNSASGDDLANSLERMNRNLSDATHDMENPAWWIFSHTPVLGRSPVAVETVTRNLVEILSNTRKLNQFLREDKNFNHLTVADSEFIVRSLSAVAEIKHPLSEAIFQINSLNLSQVPNLIREPVRRVGDDLETIQPFINEGDSYAKIAPMLFGLHHKQRFMLVFLNGAEARSIGGFPGGWGILTSQNGNFILKKTMTDSVFNNKPLLNWQNYVSIDQAAIYGNDLSRWSDMNLSPDFPTNARLMAALLKQDVGENVDGVLAIDQNALSALLAVTGPISFHKKSLNSQNIASYMNIGIYKDFSNPKTKDEAAMQIVQLVFDQFKTHRMNALLLARSFIPAIYYNHMHLWIANKTDQNIIEQTSFGGSTSNALRPTNAVVFVNGAGNKIDAYINAKIRFQQGLCFVDSPYRNSFMSIELINHAPKNGLPRYVTPRNDLAPSKNFIRGSTRMIVYVHATLGSEFTSALLGNQQVSPVAQGIDSGRQVWRFDLDLNPQNHVALTVNFAEPADGTQASPKLWTQSMPRAVISRVITGESCKR